jgi:hypothetical protein
MDSKREKVESHGDLRFVRRDEKGRFKEVDDAGRSLKQDREQHAQHTSAPGEGDRGDHKR